MNKIGFIFPGQGSQYIGMGKDFYGDFKVCKDVFDEMDDSLHMNLSEMCFNGIEEDLMKTENTQPTILATSIAILKAMESEGINCEYTAGLSLGEYSALVCGGMLSLSDTFKVSRERGLYMQQAVPMGTGGMAAILGLEVEDVFKAIEIAGKFGIVEVANYNSPGQIVISGEKPAIEVACEEALKLGAKKAVTLSVSSPFHSSLLISAGEKLGDLLSTVNIEEPNKNIISNVDVKIIKSKNEIIPKLVKQVSHSVLWQQSIELMISEGVNTFVELGPGKSLTGFVKRIGKKLNKDIRSINISDIGSFNNALVLLRGGI